MTTLLEWLTGEVAGALVEFGVQGRVDRPSRLLEVLGVPVRPELVRQPALLQAFTRMRSDLDDLASARDEVVAALADETAAGTALSTLSLVAAVTSVVDAFAAGGSAIAAAAAGTPGLTPAERAELAALGQVFTARVLETTVVDRIDEAYPRLSIALELAGVIERERVPAGPPGSLGLEHMRMRFYGDRLLALVRDPVTYLRQIYGWGTQEFDGLALFRVASAVADRLGYESLLLSSPGMPAGLELFGLALHADPSTPPPGLNLSLRQGFSVADTHAVTFEGWQLGADLTVAIPIDIDVAVTPPFELRLQTPAVSARVDAAIRAAWIAEAPLVVVGSSSASRIELNELTARVALTASWPDTAASVTLAPVVALEIRRARAVLAAGDDSLLAMLGGLDVRFDLGATWSLRDGLVIDGGAGAMTRVGGDGPVRASVRGHLELATEVVRASILVDVTAMVGPVRIAINGFGLAGELAFTGQGNLGPIDVIGGLVAPITVGVEVDSAAVRGGGVFQREGDRCAGALALDALGVALRAYGILNPRTPGFSLAAVVSADLAPVPLPLGFRLVGVGGLLGISRRADVDEMRAAIRSGGLIDLFFPVDPIEQIVRLTGDLATFFPEARGRHVIGPAAKFSWGTPTLVRGELALLLELPSPVRVVLLGSMTASLPTEEHAIVKLGVDVGGEVDFGQKRLAIDASLRGDSHVAGFPITGDMALRLAWGNPPSFALAIGGFHSRFRPPPGFPDLRRVRIPIGSGDDPRLDVEGFLALTSNTAQIGAKVELYASAGPLNITGGFGFETLLVFSPFSLEVDVWGGVALRRGTRILAGLHFDAHVSGPSPWRIDGEACLSLWFVDLCVGIHKTFGTGTPATLAAQEIWALLRPAVAQAGSWAGEMPAGSRSVASAPPAGEEPVPRVDPGAILTLRQRVVPLDRTITRFAHARPQGTDRFEVTELTVGAGAVTAPPVRNWSRAAVTDWFAPAEFEEMSEADKLSRPGFERMASGVQAGPEAVRVGDELTCPLVYDTSIYVGGVRQGGPPFQPKTREQLENLGLAINARPPSRTAGAGAYAPAPGTGTLFVLAEETYVIATTDELAPRLDLAAEGSQSEIEAALRAHLAAHPEDAARLQVVPAFDAAA